MLSSEGRYEVANRPNVEAPTDIRMRNDARGSFAELYASITGEIFRRTPGAAITEYAHLLGRHVPRRDVRELGLAEGAEPGRHRVDTRTDRRHFSWGGTAPPARAPRSHTPRSWGALARAPSWTLTRIRHRYGTDLRDDLTLRRTEPLRLTRRWRHAALRTVGRSGESAFHVQFVVEHRGCADEGTQRRAARRWATSESMWEARQDLWPGRFVLDPIASLGIEPGSSAPAGWPPPPAPAPRVEAAPERAVAAAVEEPAPSAPLAASDITPVAPAAPPPESGCTVHSGSRSRGPLLFTLFAVLALSRRRGS